jgi:hypothetical protein
LILNYTVHIVGRIAQSVWRLATGWTVQSGDRIPLGARFSSLVKTGPGANPASYTMGTRSFSWVKRPGRDLDHPPSSSADVKERVQLYLNPPVWVFVACSGVNCTFTFTVSHYMADQNLNYHSLCHPSETSHLLLLLLSWLFP